MTNEGRSGINRKLRDIQNGNLGSVSGLTTSGREAVEGVGLLTDLRSRSGDIVGDGVTEIRPYIFQTDRTSQKSDGVIKTVRKVGIQRDDWDCLNLYVDCTRSLTTLGRNADYCMRVVETSADGVTRIVNLSRCCTIIPVVRRDIGRSCGWSSEQTEVIVGTKFDNIILANHCLSLVAVRVERRSNLKNRNLILSNLDLLRIGTSSSVGSNGSEGGST